MPNSLEATSFTGAPPDELPELEELENPLDELEDEELEDEDELELEPELDVLELLSSAALNADGKRSSPSQADNKKQNANARSEAGRKAFFDWSMEIPSYPKLFKVCNTDIEPVRFHGELSLIDTFE